MEFKVSPETSIGGKCLVTNLARVTAFACLTILAAAGPVDSHVGLKRIILMTLIMYKLKTAKNLGKLTNMADLTENDLGQNLHWNFCSRL